MQEEASSCRFISPYRFSNCRRAGSPAGLSDNRPHRREPRYIRDRCGAVCFPIQLEPPSRSLTAHLFRDRGHGYFGRLTGSSVRSFCVFRFRSHILLFPRITPRPDGRCAISPSDGYMIGHRLLECRSVADSAVGNVCL